MKNRQTKIVILILLGLVLFSSSLAALLYLQQSKTVKKSDGLIAVYVSAVDIKKGSKLSLENVKQIKMPKEYVSQKPLPLKDIIGRYTTVALDINEPIRKEKLSLTKPVEEVEEKVKEQLPKVADVNLTIKLPQPKIALDGRGDAISVPISAFKNLDTTVIHGDSVDIASVELKKNGEFDTKYVALGVTIDGFLKDGNRSISYLVGTVKGKPIYADSIIMKVSPKDLDNFLTVYYKTLNLNAKRVYNTHNSGQLWLIKCAKEQSKKTLQEKEKMLVDYVKKVKQRYRKSANSVVIQYEK